MNDAETVFRAGQRFSAQLGRDFVLNVEIVPPASAEARTCVEAVHPLQELGIAGFNIADSPMARPRLSPLTCAQRIERSYPQVFEFIPHINVRDRNRIALQGLLWDARSMGIQAVLAVSGDGVQYAKDPEARGVYDLHVTELLRLARQAGLTAGVVFDPRPAQWPAEAAKLERKMEAGSQFVITQPLYTSEEVELLAERLNHYGLPVLLGVLPLISARHARFLDERVPGISVPVGLIRAVEEAGEDAWRVGVELARRMVRMAREHFAGACIMPPFNRFDLVEPILHHDVG